MQDPQNPLQSIDKDGKCKFSKQEHYSAYYSTITAMADHKVGVTPKVGDDGSWRQYYLYRFDLFTGIDLV